MVRVLSLILTALPILIAWLLSANWGPGTHIRLAERLIEEDSDQIPSDLRSLIKTHQDHFLYGNIAADIIHYKNYGGLKNHCHNWNIRERLLSHAHTDAEHAFILGYLCHLAADVIAHHHFVPFHIVYGLPPRLLGHVYWEARLDGRVAEHHWDRIDLLRVNKSIQQNDELILKAVPKRAFSHVTNKLIFNHVLLARSRRSWRAIIDQMGSREPRGVLQDKFIQDCDDACRKSLIATFQEDSLQALRELDPNGHLQLSDCRLLRQELIEDYGSRTAAVEASRQAASLKFGLNDTV